MTKRQLRRHMINVSVGMNCGTDEAMKVLTDRGVFGLISWRTRQLESMFSWMLEEKE